MTQIVTVNNFLEENAYIHIDVTSGSGFIVDPGGEPEKILDAVRRGGWEIEGVLLTHGHFDHIGGLHEIVETLGVPYYIHRNGAEYLLNPKHNLSRYTGLDIVLTDAVLLDDGDDSILLLALALIFLTGIG